MLSIESSMTTLESGCCRQCGKRLETPSPFCPRCGARRQDSATPLLSRRRQTFYFKSCTAAVLILVIGIISVATRKPRASKGATVVPPLIKAPIVKPSKPNPFLEKLLDIDASLATRPVVTAPTTRAVAEPVRSPAKSRSGRTQPDRR